MRTCKGSPHRTSHYDETGAVEHVYSHVSLGTPVARVDRTSDIDTTLEYQFHGLASSTLAAVAEDGTINASFSYTPWGDVIEGTNGGGASNGTTAHRRRHNDKYVDDISTLTYYGARHYDRTLLNWTQADPLYRLSPDRSKHRPRKSNLYAFSLNNALRYYDPDGKEPKSYAVVVQDATGSTFHAATSLITETVQETFAPRGGGAGDLLLQAASRGEVSARVGAVTSMGKGGAGTGSHILLTNLLSGSSQDAAKRNGLEGLVDKMVGDFRELARSEIGGTRIVVAVDRVARQLKKEGLDLNKPEDRQKAKAYIERMIVHEVGHNLGLCHEKECKSKNKRKAKDEELMYDSTSFTSSMYRGLSQNDIDKAANSLGRRAF